MRLALFLATAVVCTATFVGPEQNNWAVSTLNVEETQALLKYLGLDVFSEAFAKLKLNGLAVSVMQPGDLTQEDAPEASHIHFKYSSPQNLFVFVVYILFYCVYTSFCKCMIVQNVVECGESVTRTGTYGQANGYYPSNASQETQGTRRQRWQPVERVQRSSSKTRQSVDHLGLSSLFRFYYFCGIFTEFEFQ